MKKQLLASVFAACWIPHTYAESLKLDDITLRSNGFERKESETTYASEIHTAEDIEASGASTLYDFLAQQSSLNLLPSIGNKATPGINLRGFGNENGFQNVAIQVDGQRLNNIDSQPSLLAGIPVSNIERIEISKGSGSVLFGDNATAGTIQIYTKNKTGVTVSLSAGNVGQLNNYLNAGFATPQVELSASAAHDSYDGYAKKDNTGHRDSFSSDTQSVKLKLTPTERLQIRAQASNSENDIRYVNPLTRAQFNRNPRTAVGTYTEQAFNSKQWQIGADVNVTDHLSISATHYREDKLSDFVTFASAFNYDYNMDELKLRYTAAQWEIVSGYQSSEGVRKSTSSDTSKDANAWFLQADLHPTWLKNTTFSAGYRREVVDYQFKPVTSVSLNQANTLEAWDIGVNHRINATTSLFANLNQAFQAPDIDRFFTFAGAFNQFISPAKVRTLNIGVNHFTPQNKLKLTAFYADLDNEIYLVPGLFRNTNLDRSHKLGIEVQDVYQFTPEVTVSMLYNYVQAKIDRENESNGAFNHKDLPGAPRHSVVGNLHWKIYPSVDLNLNQTWRSTAYAFNDFENNFASKQSQYITTNVALNYHSSRYTLFATINNLFNRENTIQVQDDAIYPVDFVRTFRIGVRADF